MKNRKNNKGFTLAELLIVVAIIGVLTAIAIPVFTSQLEKSREATDAANIRSAYAEVMAAALTDPDNDHSATVSKKQTQNGWQSEIDVAGIKAGPTIEDSINSTVSTTITYTQANGVQIDGKSVSATFMNESETPSGDETAGG